MAGRSSGVAKSRHGCRRCKTKRIKCDEAIPACTNCLQRGWQCPGYGPNIRWSTKHERFGALSQPPQAREYGAPLIHHASQQLYNDNFSSSVLDGTAIPLDTGDYISDSGLNHTNVNPPPPQPPITPVSQCIYDDVSKLQEDDTTRNFIVPILSPKHGTGGYYQRQVPLTRDLVDSERLSTAMPTSSPSTDISSNSATYEDPFDPRMFYTPTHIPTILIEHWFSDICPMWNVFDSDSNFNRQFASASWSSSEPVFFAMQSMSAACLVDTLPAMMPVLSSLTSKALAAIQCRVSSYQDRLCTAMPPFPTDLLFAIFAMGTSLHWKHGFELGASLMRSAHSVIDCYRKRLPSMEPAEREHLAFFQKALICWEGILSAADRNFTPASFTTRRKAFQARVQSDQDQVLSQQRAYGPRALSINDAELHPWCGISSDVLQTFGQTMTLCHLAQDKRSTHSKKCNVEKDYEIGLARELASELANMEFTQENSRDVHSLRTNDSDTPLSHLIGIAEAYRQACFLQLCLTFEDLSIDASAYSNLGLAVPSHTRDTIATGMTRAQYLVGLSLRLVESLKKIPPESGSRCMQPLLYLCAASGLQLNPLPPLEETSSQLSIFSPDGTKSQHDACFMPCNDIWSEGGLETSHTDRTGLPDASTALYSGTVAASPILTISAFKVAQARSFVKKRLGMLQQLLPPRYTGTALKLAEAIWAEYDCTSSGGRPLYWVDVMVREKLQTFFG